jgi:hypothetical protein
MTPVADCCEQGIMNSGSRSSVLLSLADEQNLRTDLEVKIALNRQLIENKAHHYFCRPY